MAKLFRTLTALATAGILVGAAGFVAFAEKVRTQAPSKDVRADGIVVLTGDEERISTGVRLMVEGRARRLLITGVHPGTRVPSELKRRIEGSDATREAIVRCCVDIGHDATNTSGNAEEARQWIDANGFRSVIVVTSGYHMLRSLAEFARVLPEIKLESYPVLASRALHLDRWWGHWPTARLLAGEYIKTLGAAAKLALSRSASRSDSAQTKPAPSPGLPSASANVRTAP